MARALFIFGCQRSGTTMLLEVLGRCPATEAFGEDDPRVMSHLRLRSIEAVEGLLAAGHEPVLVFKPICDSHHADHILMVLDGSRGIWIYRDFRDVVNSATRMWPGHMLDQIGRLYEGRADRMRWRGERLPAAWIDETTRVPLGELTDQDAYALFWHLRNRVFLERGLAGAKEALLVRYEHLATRPEREFGRVFEFAGLPFDRAYVADVSARRIGRTPPPRLHADVERMCEDLLARLDEARG